jgi:hypothetical protein
MRTLIFRVAAALFVLGLGLSSCSQNSGGVLLDTCAPISGDVDHLQVTFTDKNGATGSARYDRSSDPGSDGAASVTLDGNIAYPVTVVIRAYNGDTLVSQAQTTLMAGQDSVMACLEPPGVDGGPDLPDVAPGDPTADVPPPIDMTGDVAPDRPVVPDLPDVIVPRDATPDMPPPPPPDLPPDLPPPDMPATPDMPPPPPDMCHATGSTCTVDEDCCSQSCRPNRRCE